MYSYIVIVYYKPARMSASSSSEKKGLRFVLCRGYYNNIVYTLHIIMYNIIYRHNRFVRTPLIQIP